LVSISSCAAVATLEIGEHPRMTGKNIVVILPSLAERCQSTPLLEELQVTQISSESRIGSAKALPPVGQRLGRGDAICQARITAHKSRIMR
jgi:hypothetical protein